MSPSQRAGARQADLEAAQAADDAAVDDDLLGDDLALHRRGLADDQHLGAHVALDDALDLDVAARVRTLPVMVRSEERTEAAGFGFGGAGIGAGSGTARQRRRRRRSGRRHRRIAAG